MKKIMFNKKYGLERAAIAGTKPLTRRMISKNFPTEGVEYIGINERGDLLFKIGDNYVPEIIIPPYKVGEVVAIAQSYKDAGYTKEWVVRNIKPNPKAKPTDPFEKKYPGWTNKMFVKAEFMLNFIQFTDRKVERLQDISDEDCIKEGILRRKIKPFNTIEIKYQVPKTTIYKDTPREAFAALIDKVSGRGTWERNPWVFAYSYKLVK